MSAGEGLHEICIYLSEEECDSQLVSPKAECTGVTGNYEEFLVRHRRYGHTGRPQSQQQSSRSRVRPDDENGDEATVRQESTGRRSSRSQASSERACDVCGRRFANSSHLARHRRTHRGSSDEFLCADCLLSFARKDALQRHMLTHTGLRPYICRVCGSAFTQRSSATRHERNIHGLP
ncbi:zinc finger protein 2-like isoform X2 [Dermacentor silvarum]|uniref:zinc finger protein 2-like isoform X2 n=1 Tax=Dermacentor silvarum TaxID=543639 RepID=UPI002100CD85|nr:zinc finger protein 2-like isoform X2 [Dermacentor silvarum]